MWKKIFRWAAAVIAFLRYRTINQFPRNRSHLGFFKNDFSGRGFLFRKTDVDDDDNVALGIVFPFPISKQKKKYSSAIGIYFWADKSFYLFLRSVIVKDFHKQRAKDERVSRHVW